MTAKPAVPLKETMFSTRNLCLLVVVVVGLGVALFGDKGALRLRAVNQQQQQLTVKLQQLTDLNRSLHHQLDALKHNDRYVERVARAQLGFVRDGEFVYQFCASRQ